MRALILSFAVLIAAPVQAEDVDLKTIVENHVLPRYETLATETGTLAQNAVSDCAPTSPALIEAYHKALDAWVGVSHLRFGPSEQEDRAFAIAFWPDPRGATPKALAALFRDEDPVVGTPEEFAEVSIAGRGLYALEFLLFDPQFRHRAPAAYHCALVQAVTTDIAANATAILAGWQDGYAGLMSTPGNDVYRTRSEAVRQLFTALSTGLEFTSQTRLGRPMGTFDRPRPNRAEARRSGRSLRHVILALTATRELAALISLDNADVDRAFGAALKHAESLDDPVFSGVAKPQGRLKVEVLQQRIEAIRTVLATDIGPSLGISAGFNSLDGD